MTKVGVTRHMGIAKRLLIQWVYEDGPQKVLTNVAKDLSTEEAIKLIREDPREVFCSCDCPKDDDGSCLGR